MKVWIIKKKKKTWVLVDDAWKINSKVHGKHAIQRHLHNTKREDLTESTGVVPAEYPMKVKLEFLTTLECYRGINYAYLGW